MQLNENIIKILKKLGGYFEKSNNLSQQLLQKMQLLKKEKNNEILRVGGIRYDIQLLNGMINIQASPNKYYGKF